MPSFGILRNNSAVKGQINVTRFSLIPEIRGKLHDSLMLATYFANLQTWCLVRYNKKKFTHADLMLSMSKMQITGFFQN